MKSAHAKNQILLYQIKAPQGFKINLNLWDAEHYIHAIYVQSLIGNLVYYSNFGRYEPRLASHWKTLDAKTWTFYLRPDLKAENGEPITGHSFKQSIERTLRFVSKKERPPLFHKLVGFDDFISHNKELTGITATDSTIEFTFQEPIRSGLLQVLSLAPYGYISQDNLNPDGSWRDSKKFISSGPYSVTKMTDETTLEMGLRQDWQLQNSTAPGRVRIQLVNEFDLNNGSTSENLIPIFDAIMSPSPVTSDELIKFSLAPEYLHLILLEDENSGLFADSRYRAHFKKALQFLNQKLDLDRNRFHLTSEFYYKPGRAEPTDFDPNVDPIKKPNKPLLIQGAELHPDSPKYLIWQRLKAALELLGWDYRFSGDTSVAGLRSRTADIRMLVTSVGSPSNVWGREIQFCSHIGFRLPDPGGRVCKLIQKYNKSDMDLTTFESEFVQTVNEQSSLVPLAYSGNVLYLSKSIDASTLSPMVSIVRFDQLGLLKNE